MNIENIDIFYVEKFNSEYLKAETDFGVEPIKASEKIKKKIRKQVYNHYVSVADLPDEVMQYVDGKVSDDYFIRFLKACKDRIQVDGTRRRQLFNGAAIGLDVEAKEILWSLMEKELTCSALRKSGKNALIEIDIETNSTYSCVITLVDASDLPEKYDWISFENGTLTKQDGEYRLVGEIQIFETDTYEPFAIRFKDAEVKISVYKATEKLFSQTPWHQLQAISGLILDKCYLPDKYLNENEKAILPLLAEINKLFYYNNIVPDEYKSANFYHLKCYIEKYGYKELIPAIHKVEMNYYEPKKKERLLNKLISKLNLKKYEPMWREIFDVISGTQEVYPSRAELNASKELLNETRSNIQKLIEEYGYEGTYPDFVKKAPVKGTHLVDSYSSLRIIPSGKNATYYIHCTEEYFNNHLMVEFICGTALLKQGEDCKDIYSCLFNAKGRRLFETVCYESEYINSKCECIEGDLNHIVSLAVKRAELIPLTKEEKKIVANPEISYLKLFFKVLAIAGGFFTAIMAGVFFLIWTMTCFFYGQPLQVLSFFTDVKMFGIFLMVGLVLGTPLGILAVMNVQNKNNRH